MSSDNTSQTQRSLVLASTSSLPATQRQTLSHRAKTTFTVREKILLAAVECRAEGFSSGELVLRAWTLFPESFSLGGTTPEHAHPDSNRVLAKLSGQEGLRALGWIKLIRTSTYQVTGRGREHVAKLRATTVPMPRREPLAPSHREPSKRDVSASFARESPLDDAPTPSSLSKPWSESLPSTVDADVNVVRWIVRGGALRKFLRGSPLSFADARAFWSVHAQTSDVSRRVAEVGALLERVVRLFDNGGQVDARLPALSTCYGLLNLHRLMRTRFARELDAVASRSGA